MGPSLLTDEHAARAREAVADVAEAVRRDAEALVPTYAAATLAEGHAGLALFHAELGDRERAVDSLERAFVLIAEQEEVWPSLHHGAAGVGLAATLLERRFGPLGDEDLLGDVDAALLDRLRQGWGDEFDVMRGLAGLAVYALERLPRPEALEMLERIVDALAAQVSTQADGLAWRTAPRFEAAASDGGAVQPFLDLGMAHGNPGVIALLARLLVAGVARARVATLLEGAVSWLIAKRLPPGSPAAFVYSLRVERPPEPARLAWCYGDPGVAAALFAAGTAARRDDWLAVALEVARGVAARSQASSGVVDASLCHGAAGVAHILHRLHRASGEPALAEAARRWFEVTLTMRRPGEGVGGFTVNDRHAALPDRSDPGLLVGAAGVALALHAAVTGAEPSWDRMLLVDCAPAVPAQ